MTRLRLRHSSTPARLYSIENLEEFGKYGEVKLNFKYEGKQFEYIVSYTKPYIDEKAGKFATYVNLNQNAFTASELKKPFQDWQNLVTHKGTNIIDITDLKYIVLSK